MAPIIDGQFHVWRAATSNITTIVPTTEDVPIDRARAVFDSHGIARAVVVQPVFRGEDNSYIADCAAADPARFAAVCVVDPRVEGAEDRLESWVVERGCRGFRLRPRVADEAAIFGDPRTYPLWERARNLKVVVSILANPEHLVTIGALADRFPEVPIVIDHLAHPKVSEGVSGADFQTLLGLARFPNIRIKMSGYYHFTDDPPPYRSCWDLFRAIYERFGADRLFWASDYPHVERTTGYGACLELVQRQLPFLDDAARKALLCDTAARLYWPAG